MEQSSRIVSIDRMKGLIVFCMVFFIAAAEFPCLGILSRVANNSDAPLMLFHGVTLADLESPCFLFLIGLTYQTSFDRRRARRRNGAYLHFLVRYLCFMGLGSVIVSFEYAFITNRRDPLFVQTLLMGVFFVLLLLFAVFFFSERKTHGAAPKTAQKCAVDPSLLARFRSCSNCEKAKLLMALTLICLGVIDIFLMLRDDILILQGFGRDALYMHWSILHELGFTGLLTIPFLPLSRKGKLLAWSVLTVLYTAVQLPVGMVDKFGVIFLGGGMGCLGWLILMLGGILMFSLYTDSARHGKFFAALALITVFAYFSCLYLPVNTRAVTVNYVLLSLAVDSAVFAAVNVLNRFRFHHQVLIWWGRNPLLLFFIGLLLKVPLILWDPAPDTPLFLALLAVGGSTALLTGIARFCFRKNILLKL